VDPSLEWVISLEQAASCPEQFIGGKAAKLAQLAQSGFRVPGGFCITTAAYELFLEQQKLARVIQMELGRKPFTSMRWEEIWDVALRIRSAFLVAAMPNALAEAIGEAVENLGTTKALAVRSSAPGEDSAARSFAGLHESVVGVVGVRAVLDAVRVVWASLWSDAALLYRQELSLDPGLSRMAVVVQAVIDEDRSGVAFGRDPREIGKDQAIIEAVPGPCGDLVDGNVDPDHWVVARSSGSILAWRPGDRGQEEQARQPILDSDDLGNILQTLLRLEAIFQWPADTEWTGRHERFTLLQARPITTTMPERDDQRAWYLSLRPGMRRLDALSERVAHELIPELEKLGLNFASEPVEQFDDLQLAQAIEERHAAVQRWREIYLEDFIPFAHGVRQLGIYYNDAVRPEDPYEFVGLLRGQRMAASQRNEALQKLSDQARADKRLVNALGKLADERHDQPESELWRALNELREIPGGRRFSLEFRSLVDNSMDVAYDGERLSARPDLILQTVIEMARAPQRTEQREPESSRGDVSVGELEERLLYAVGEQRYDEARQVLAIGRLSWRLRDDDNVLVGRLEGQLLRVLEIGAARLRANGRLQDGGRPRIESSLSIVQALRDPRGGPVALPEPEQAQAVQQSGGSEYPRQLVGQPAAPGVATGKARSVRGVEDLGRFRAGEVLVCDAIQPTMTHLVPLACGIVERRGGMLIHGAIIARELGIPSVNGVAEAVNVIPDGEIVTVDGYLGIVTVGPPEFDLEAST
jgi:phosphohistidine swiveling domain-containing protein